MTSIDLLGSSIKREQRLFLCFCDVSLGSTVKLPATPFYVEVLSKPEQDHFYFLICHVCGFLGEVRSNREQHLSFTFVVMFTFVCWFAGKFCQVPIHTACLHPHTGHPCRVQQPMPLRVQAAAMVYKTAGNPQNCVTQHGGVIPRVI